MLIAVLLRSTFGGLELKILKRIRKKFLLKLFVLLAASGAFWIFCENMAARLLLPIAKSQIERYTGSEVKIGDIEVGLNGIVKLKWVLISSSIDGTGNFPLLIADTVEARFSILSILTLRPRLGSLTVEDFILDVCYDRNLSAWNLVFIEGDEGKSKKNIPALHLTRGVVQLSKVSGETREKIISVAVKKGEVADIGKKNGFGFTFKINPYSTGLAGIIGGKLETSKKGEVGKLIITSENFSTGNNGIFGNIWDVHKMRLDLDYNADDLTVNTLVWEMGEDCKFSLTGEVTDYQHACNYSGQLHVKNMFVSEKAKADSLVYGEGLSENIGKHLREFLRLYKPNGVCDLDFKAVGRFGELLDSQWSGVVGCKDLSIEHERFPYYLQHISGDVKLDSKSIDYSNLKCMHDDVVFDIDGGTVIADGIKVTNVVVTSDNVLLGNDIYRALNKKQQSIWYTFTPKGRAKVKYEYHRRQNDDDVIDEDEKGVGKLQIDMIGGEADYLHFPYHLENITGRVTISPDKVELIDLVSGTEGSSITLNGEVSETRSKKPRYNILINANNIPLDSRLKAALPYSQRSFYDSFKMTARTDVKIKIFPNEVGDRLVEYIAEVSIKDALMMYEGFPLPLSEVNVDATLTPAGTFLHKMTGRNGDGEVNVNGTIWPSDQTHSRPGYCLELNAKNIQVQDRWLKSLPEDSYKLLSQLRPKGAINVAANLSLDPRAECPAFKIVVESLGGHVNYTKFPYQINDIYGKVTIEKDKISLENIKAIGPVGGRGKDAYSKSIAVDGVIMLVDNKFKNGEFSVLAENIECDDKLGKALGSFSGNPYKRLNPSGRFDLAIDKITYSKEGESGGVLDFSSELTLKEVAFGDGSIFAGVNGAVTASGVYKVGEGLVRGEGSYQAKEMKIKGRTLENMRGEIVYDPLKDSYTCREYIAKCYGGNVIGSLSFVREKDRKINYAIEAILSHVDIHGLMTSETKVGEDVNYTKGYVSGYMAAMGVLGDDSSRVGRLKMEVSEMEFAERTLLGKIMTASQLEDPTDYIFSDVEVEAYLQKDMLYLDKVEVSGKSMQMKGAGKVDVNSGNIDMKFNAFGKRTSKPSFVETLTRSLGSAVVEVEVKGTFDKPKIKKTTLPVLKRPFGIFGDKEKK